jgi:hypothetical protein
MTGVLVTCPNCHPNPPGQNFCGECGAALGGSAQTDQTLQASFSEDGTLPDGLEPIRAAQAWKEAGAQGPAEAEVAAAASRPAESAAQSELHPQPKHIPLDEVERILAGIPRNSPHAPKATGVLSKRAKLSPRWVIVGAVVLAVIIAAALSGLGRNQSGQAHSPSYQMGYDAAAPQPGVPGPRDLSDAQISQFCSGLLEARISGEALGTNTQLPLDFSSQDFLTGCTNASQAYKGQ